MKRLLVIGLSLASAMTASASPTGPPPPRWSEPPLPEGATQLDYTVRQDGKEFILIFTGTELLVRYQVDRDNVPRGDPYFDGAWATVKLATGKGDIRGTQAGTIAFHGGDQVAFVTFVTDEEPHKHKGGIFMTANGGRDWRRVSRAPSQGVSIIDPTFAISLGSPGLHSPARAMGVSRDGGKTWTTVGVPDEDGPIPPDPSAKGEPIGHSSSTPAPRTTDFAIRCAWHEIGYVSYDRGKTWARCGVTDPNGAPRWGCLQFMK